jgi:hypothetical protein
VSGWRELVRPFTVSPTVDRVLAWASNRSTGSSSRELRRLVAHDRLAELILERVRARFCKPGSAADVEAVAIWIVVNARRPRSSCRLSWVLISGNSAGLSTSVDRGHEAQGGTDARGRHEAVAEFVFDDQAVQPEVSSLETKSISPGPAQAHPTLWGEPQPVPRM